MTEHISLSDSFGLMLTLPFNLGFSTRYVGAARTEQLTEVANALARLYPECRWSAMPLTQVPSLLAAKRVVLVGRPTETRRTHLAVSVAFAEENIGATLSEVDVEVVYLDHGMGSVCVSIEGKLHTANAIANLQRLATRILNDLQTKGSEVSILADWPKFHAAALTAARETGHLYDMWGILGGGGQLRERMLCVGDNAFLRSETDGPLSVDTRTLANYAASFVGLEPEQARNLAPTWPGVVLVNSAWEGQFAVVTDRESEARLRNLWHFGANYWAIITDLDAYLYQLTLESTTDRSLSMAQEAIVQIQKVEMAIDILTHESLPNNFADQGHELAVYGAMYDSWGTSRFIESIKGKFEHLSVRQAGFSAISSNRGQSRMNIVMLVFTVLTFASVIADVVSAVDNNGTMLDSRARLFLIVFGVITAACLAVFAFLFRGELRK